MEENRNTGDRNTGYLNTLNPKVTIFNKTSDIDFWNIVFPEYFYFDFVPSYVERVEEKDMSEIEKANNPTYKTTSWYLKVTENDKELKSYRRKSWDKASHDDRMKTFSLPNFDADIFEEITWLHIHDYGKEEYKIILNSGEEKVFSSVSKLKDFISSLEK